MRPAVLSDGSSQMRAIGTIIDNIFGHEKGAFTGAHRRKPGHFERANNGTIYLDEIGELPLALQAKLLHVLQDFCFSRVGGAGSIDVDSRVIAATNRNLEEAMGEGKRFRRWRCGSSSRPRP